jgi:hypothetical protein
VGWRAQLAAVNAFFEQKEREVTQGWQGVDLTGARVPALLFLSHSPHRSVYPGRFNTLFFVLFALT